MQFYVVDLQTDTYLCLPPRDVMELKALLVETQDIVDVKPWTIEPQMKFDARGSGIHNLLITTCDVMKYVQMYNIWCVSVCTSKSLDSVSDASSDLDSVRYFSLISQFIVSAITVSHNKSRDISIQLFIDIM